MIGLKYKSTATPFPSINSLNIAVTPAPLLLNYFKKFPFVRSAPSLLSCVYLAPSTFICKLSLAIFLPFSFFSFCFSCLLPLLLILPQKSPKSQLGKMDSLEGVAEMLGQHRRREQQEGLLSGRGCCWRGGGDSLKSSDVANSC